jgi:hypothetical protein
MSQWNEAQHPRGKGEHGGEWVKKVSDKIGGDLGEGQTAQSLHLTPNRNAMGHPGADHFYQRSAANTALSGDAKKSVLEYAWGGPQFEKMNGALRGDPNKVVSPETAAGIKSLTAAIKGNYLKKPTIVHRGMPDTPANRKLISGKKIVDHGFMSTSTDKDVAELSADPIGEGKGIILNIKLPVGTSAVSIGDQFDSEGGSDQSEILIQRGSQFKITGKRQVGGFTHVDAMLVLQSRA